MSDESAAQRYWADQFREPAPGAFTTDHPRPPVSGFMRATETIADDELLLDSGGTQTHIAAAAAALLGAYAGETTVAVGVVMRDEQGSPIPVPLRVDAPIGASVGQWQDATEGAWQSASPHAMPLDDVVAAAGIERSMDRSPIVQVMALAVDGADEDRIATDDVDDLAATLNACDLVFTARGADRGAVLECNYNAQLFEAETVQRLLAHWGRFLQAMFTDPQLPAAALPYLVGDDYRRVVSEWNETHRDFNGPATLHGRFEAQVARTPDAVALEFADERLTYRDLNARANRTARTLQERGVRPGMLVGVCLERSVELVTSLYAIAKTGAAYVPLDPDYPPARLRYMIETADCPLVVTHSRLSSQVSEFADNLWLVDDETDAESPHDDNLDVEVSGSDLAYVIFTSGSTGRPKGVMNEHAGIVNRLAWMQSAFALSAEDVVLQKTPYSFDVSVWEFFWPLQVGARLAIAKPGDHRDAAQLAATIQRHDVTTIHFVPSMLQSFLNEPAAAKSSTLQRVIVSGEALTPALRDRFFATLDAELHNLYGPTEAAVDVTWWPCHRDDSSARVPIGKPIANTQIYILNEAGTPLPPGAAGELHIGGVQVARGYLHREELTKERFIADPFANDAGARLYKTGDLARYDREGNIEYLGRLDFQVKIRGFRIELGEIEAVLARHDDVERVAAVVNDDPNLGPQIIAYAQPIASGTLDTGDLKSFAATSLPDFMLPARIVELTEWPLTASGKLDRKALPDPAENVTSAAELALPQSDIEETLAELWRDALGVEAVGVDDNFFDLGGHSLLLADIRGGIRERFGRELAMLDLFQYPTVAALAAFLAGETSAEVHSDREASTSVTTDDIAVVGMAVRLPGASTVDQYWQNLRDGVESITFFSDEALLDAGVDPELIANPRYVKASGVLEDIEAFDAAFFGYSRREAQLMDPQQRLFLECVWQAAEDAGYHFGSGSDAVGVYAGVGMNTYVLENLAGLRDTLGDVGAFQLMIGNDKDFMPTRVAYKLDLKGPAVNVQTACSTSLVAVHMARRALLENNCRVAVAGGVSVRIPHVVGYLHEEGMIYAPDGHCRSFDAEAQGTVFGSGAGAVVLKKLRDAQADGDQIYAVIKGSAINNDGADKIGYTAPSIEGQAAVIRAAQREADVTPDTVTLIEAHGTATPLGDPVEIAALTKAFRRGTDARGYCRIGSVKSNIGHVDAAAGVAGLIKATLALHHAVIPKSLHFNRPNPQIDFGSSPFRVADDTREWVCEGPRRAGVSSFGIGGTNAHVVLEQSPALEASSFEERPGHLLRLSARDEAALQALAQRYVDHLPKLAEDELGNACFTANTGRAHFGHRLAVEGADAEALVKALDAYGEGRRHPALAVGQAQDGSAKVAVLFTGQGAQYVGMGRQLYATQSVFREALDECDALLREATDIALIEALFDDDHPDRLDQTGLTQPALFAVEYALYRLWQSWGVQADAVMGHSVGEYVAACVAGVWSLSDALALIAERGRLMQALPAGGSMASVAAGEAAVREVLAGHDGVDVAALNSPAQTVISGAESALEPALAAFAEAGIKSIPLKVSHAFHSRLMEPMLDTFEAFVGQRPMGSPQLDVVSNVTGKLADESLLTAAYWREHVRGAVRFADGIQALYDAGYRTFLEVGPQPVLSGLGKAGLDDADAVFLPSLRRGKDDWSMLLRSLGGLYVRGVPVDWAAYDAPYPRRRVSLPTYPFQRERFWIEPTEREAGRDRQDDDAHPLLGRPIALPLTDELRYANRVSRHRPAYVNDHRVFGALIVPGASHVSLFLTGARDAYGLDHFELNDMFFVNPFTLSEDGERDAQLIYQPVDDATVRYTLASRPEAALDGEAWVTHATGNLSLTPLTGESAHDQPLDVEAIRARCSDSVSAEDFYRDTWVQGDDAGPSFRWLDEIYRGKDEAICSTRVPELDHDTDGYAVYPGLIEACYQALRCAREFESQRLLKENGIIYVPFSLGRLRYLKPPAGDRLWCYARFRADRSKADTSAVGDLWLAESDGTVIAYFEGFECRRLTREALSPSLQNQRSGWYHHVVWRPSELPVKAATDPRPLIVYAAQERVPSLPEALSGSTVVSDTEALRGALTDKPSCDLLFIADRDPDDPAAMSGATVQQGVLEQAGALLDMVHTVSAAAVTDTPRLWIAIWNSADDHAASLSGAGLRGLARVLAVEHPEWRPTLIEMDSEAALLALAQEIARTGDETEIAYRDGKRHVGRLERHKVQSLPQRENAGIRSDASYLITGGLGDLGLRCAQWLVDSGASRIALAGRRAPGDAAREHIDRWRAQGIDVLPLAVDVADEEALGAIWPRVAETEGKPLRGILHAAGALDDGVIEQQTRERLAPVLNPKVKGTWNLHRLTLDEPLDFFICFSSATALLGAGGQANYAVANAFLDAFAAYRSELDLPVVSVQWGPWSEVGMASRLDDIMKRRMENHGWGWIDPEGAMGVLEDLIARDVSQTAVLPIHWPRWLQSGVTAPRFDDLRGSGRRMPTKGSAPKKQRDGDVRRKILAAPERRRRDELAGFVRDTVASVLALDPDDTVDPQAGFTEMGMDSLMSIELRRNLQEGLSVSLPSTFSFDHPNVVAATDFILAQLVQELGETESEAAPAAAPTVTEAATDDDLEAELARLEASLGRNGE